jgi:UDPglucose--hexose-1-phosphate uridylyltransferase
MNLFEHPHRRYNILTGEWVLVSPHRTKRPWKGKTETVTPIGRPHRDPSCYLCPGNQRAGGTVNPEYTGAFAIANDFAALYLETPIDSINTDGLLVAESERGECRVICYSPRHDRHLTHMSDVEIEAIVGTWSAQFQELGSMNEISYVQIFENRGERMGASSPHPHCQIWANETVPVIPSIETESQRRHSRESGSCLLCDYATIERELNERLVFGTPGFDVIVPFWAVWPYETIIIPRAHRTSISELSADERIDLARVIRRLATRYDNLFETEFPYSMGIHQRPTDGGAHDEWHMHLHFYPPLLRSASVAKFMVGYELLAMPQRDITPEAAAQALGDLPDIHFSKGNKR